MIYGNMDGEETGFDSSLLTRSFFVYYKKRLTTNMCKVHVKPENCASFILL